MNIEIAHLYEHPALRPAVAQLIHGEFWTDKPAVSWTDLAARLSGATRADRVPISRIALVDGELAGTVNLIDCDDDDRAQLWPWLAAMVVVAPWRGRGIGTRLLRTLIDDARALGLRQMFLGTDGPGFYERLGAQVHEQVRSDFVIMRLPVPDA
jgi:predicted N-acetyltransferase YhbS